MAEYSERTAQAQDRQGKRGEMGQVPVLFRNSELPVLVLLTL